MTTRKKLKKPSKMSAEASAVWDQTVRSASTVLCGKHSSAFAEYCETAAVSDALSRAFSALPKLQEEGFNRWDLSSYKHLIEAKAAQMRKLGHLMDELGISIKLRIRFGVSLNGFSKGVTGGENCKCCGCLAESRRRKVS